MKLIDNYILDNNEKIKDKFLNKTDMVKTELEKVISFLKSGNGYVSLSSKWQCEFCTEKLTRLYSTDGKWIWGKWIIHYIEKHNVNLPVEFINDMKKFNYKSQKLSEEQINSLINGETEEISY
ncbi:hypothetical protein JAO71_04145 [Olleya sp. YSTF-M6]|uniref:Uncharacterized protein n=1 Tax=Olleya sediminilitoris TaxID=2795739 RepID=A0ABS1WIR0_9FLAO|nr:hypothetical protein [Olleya sediminilitoris]MBL7558988.1 hypothetical protein [Olleya sediminilitoris]